MDWPSTPWTLAGYSDPAPGEVCTVGPLLYAGMGDRLHFAGEHTCYKFLGIWKARLIRACRLPDAWRCATVYG